MNPVARKPSRRDAPVRRKPAPDGRPGFFVCDWQCPMHGVEIAELEGGEARIIRTANDDEPI